MASSLLLLLDDIASVMDDVATLTQVATKKTAGVLGDDLALNAQQVSGVQASRELPVVWAVAKGSAINKSILVPAALLISAVAPWAVTALLMIGGAYLCFEGAEKLVHKLLHAGEAKDHQQKLKQALTDPKADLAKIEREKIRGAIRTDFILSAEIIVISLGTVAGQPLLTRIGVLTAIAAIMTIGVYGLVAGIVKLDDGGLALTRSDKPIWQKLGRAILASAPWLMKFLSIAGTAAMFLVGGGIISHNVPWLHHANQALAQRWDAVAPLLVNLVWTALVGLAVGIALVGMGSLVKQLRSRTSPG